MKKTAILFALLLILTTAFILSCGGGANNAMKEMFTISYNANGADSGTVPASQHGDEDSPQEVQANTGNLAKSGYLFDGWNTDANGSGTDYAPSASYKGKSATLYAKWVAIFNVQVINPGYSAPALNGIQRAPGVPYIKILGLTAKGRTLANINIPSTIDGYQVVSIGNGAFQNCDFITELIIPETVSNIENNAFSACIGLSTLTIPRSVTSIGDGAFSGCAGLNSLILFTATPPAMGTGALEGTTVTVSVPSAGVDDYKAAEGWNTYSSSIAGYSAETYTVTFNSQGATVEASPLTKTVEPPYVTLRELPAPPSKNGYKFNGWYKEPEGAGGEINTNTVISNNMMVYAKWIALSDKEVFTYSINNSEVTITGLTTEGKKMSSITIPSDIDGETVAYIGNRAFISCSEITNLVIPSSIISIGEEAFYRCKGLSNLIIPDSVTSIGDNAFDYCIGLTSVSLGTGIISIGNQAFFGCKRLLSITIPNNVTSIGESAFYRCDELTTVNFNAINCTTMGSRSSTVFKLCNKLTSLHIGNMVKNIPDYAFYHCSGLTGLTIPNSVTSIGFLAFGDCTGISGNLVIPNSVTNISECAFDCCAGITDVTISNGLTTLNGFSGCTGLISISIPNSVTAIGNNTFNSCLKLTSITIPDSVTTIGEYVFAGCTNLANITIPENVTSIGNWTFKDCTSLSSLTLQCVTPPDVEIYIFYDCSSLASIRVPSSSVGVYKTTAGWQNFEDLVEGY